MRQVDHTHRIAFGLAALAVVTVLSERQPNGVWRYDPGAWAVAFAYVVGTALSFCFDLWGRR